MHCISENNIKIKKFPLDNGTKFMPPSNLEFTKMNVDNLSENVVPQSATAKFNVRFNTKYKSSSLKKKLNQIISSIAKKEMSSKNRIQS